MTDADSYVIDVAAAASVILSTKIHESKAKALSTVRSTMLTYVYKIYYGGFKQKEALYS